MTISIKNTIERTRQYWYIDGFSELLVGAIFVFLGLLNCASLVIRPSIGSAVIVGIGYPLVILGGIIFGNKWVRSMKEKVTYPRTGYVKYIQSERPSRRTRMIKALVIAFMVSIVVNVVISRLDPFWLVFGTGLMIAAFTVYMGVLIPLSRFYLTAVWIVAVSLLAARLPYPDEIQMGLLLTGTGLGWLIAGASSLILYVRKNPLPTTGIEED